MILFIVGPPAAGKTSVARHLIEPLSKRVQKPKWTVGKSLVAAGHYMGEMFDGSDQVQYDGVPEALEFWSVALQGYKTTLIDGDRFANSKVLQYFIARKAQCKCVHITAPPNILADRRKQRGSTQATHWLLGKATKSERFADMFSDTLHLLSDRPSAHMAQKVMEFAGIK